MSVVHMSTYRRRGGLRREAVWTERAFPDRHWIISAVVPCEDGQRRVVIEPLEDRSMEAVYSEAYFRRHFIDRHQWLRRQNEKVLRKAHKKDSADLLHEMAQINAR
ncbi:PhzA/PhzB family protein [Ramlibacter sp. PS4R-6]|uniref:PhzA/PhzB family protein n=1 Tax=Ramlibacter sp. PS4R-6 TaxID=3133438 RepID=UPI0030A6ECB4